MVLFDDDAHKAQPEEQRNLVKVPCWDDRDMGDAVLEELVEAVKEVFGALGEEGDVREATEKVSQRLERRAEQSKETREERERLREEAAAVAAATVAGQEARKEAAGEVG